MRSARTAGCIQRGEEKTGESFRSIAGYIEKHKPRAFILENLLETTTQPEAEDVSDAEWASVAAFMCLRCSALELQCYVCFLRPYLALAFRWCR